MANERLRSRAEVRFVRKDCDRNANNVKAAIVTAASKMANVSEIISSQDALEELILAFGIEDDQAVQDLIGMNPSFVKGAIGYSVDFQDWGAASAAYNGEKEAYDAFYTSLQQSLEKRRSLENQEKSKTI